MYDVEKIRKAIAKAEAEHPLIFENGAGRWAQENGEPTKIALGSGLKTREIRQIWSRDIVQIAAMSFGYKLAKVGDAHRLLRIGTNEVDINKPTVDRVQSLLEVLERPARSAVKV